MKQKIARWFQANLFNVKGLAIAMPNPKQFSGAFYRRSLILIATVIIAFSTVAATGISAFLLPASPVAALADNKADCEADGDVWAVVGGGDSGVASNFCREGPAYHYKKMSVPDRVLSYATLNGLYNCLINGDSHSQMSDQVLGPSSGTGFIGAISEGNVKSGKWWNDGHWTAGSYLNPTTGTTPNHDGNTECNSVLQQGISLWGFSDGLDLLCTTTNNMRRTSVGQIQQANFQSGGSCRGGPSDERFAGINYDLLIKGLLDRVYDGMTYEAIFTTVDPGAYLLYSYAFEKSCSPTADTLNQAPPEYKYERVPTVNDDGTITYVTYEGEHKDTKRYVYSGGRGDGDRVQESCGQIAEKMKEFADEYAKYRKINPNEIAVPTPGRTPPGGGGDNQTACNITGFGWIVCQTMGAISWATESLYSWIESQLILNPLSQTDAYGNQTPQYIAWQAMRNIANVVLVIGFLIIIFSQLTGAGVSNYGVKKLLPRLVIVAIAINISFLVMQIAVDVVNIIGVSIQPLLQSATPGFITDFGKTAEDMMAGIGIFSATALAGAAFAVGAGGLGAAVIIALLFIFGAFLSLVAAIFTIFIRNAAVIILAVIAPIAFAAYLLPNTEKLFDQWRKLFTSMLFLYPVVALLFGGAGFAAVVVAGGTETEWWQPFVGMFIAAAPLAALPFILRSSNKILGAVGGGLQNLAKRGSKATRDGIQPFLDRRKAEYQSGQRRWIGGYRSQQAQSRRRTLGQALNDRKLTDQMIAQGATNVAQQNIIRKGQQGVAAGGKQARSGAARAAALSNTTTALTQANQGLAQANINRALATPAAQGGLQNLADQIHDAELEAEEQKQIIRRRNTRRVANLNIEDVEGQSTVSGRRLSEIVQKTRADNEQASATELKIDHNTLTQGDAETRQDIAEGIQEQARLKPEIENVLSGINQVVDIQKSIKGTREEAAESERRAYDQSSKTRQDEQHANFAERIVEGTTQEDERLRSIASGATAAAAPADNLRANLTGPLDQEEQEQFDLIRGQLLDNANVSTAATRATAQAVQVTDESKQRAIAAEGVVLRNRGYSPKDDIIPKLRNKENPNADGQPATPEQLMAMIQYVGQNGTVKEIAEMTDILSDSSYSPAQNPQYDGVIKFFGQTLKSTGRVKSIGAGAIAVLEQGKQIGRFSSLIADRINGGKLGPEAIAGMEVDEIDLYIDHFNSTPRTADGIGKISNERVDQFKKDIDERITNDDLKRSLTPEITEKLAALKKAIDNPQPKT